MDSGTVTITVWLVLVVGGGCAWLNAMARARPRSGRGDEPRAERDLTGTERPGTQP